MAGTKMPSAVDAGTAGDKVETATNGAPLRDIPTNGTTNGSVSSALSYEVLDQYHSKRSSIRVAGVGAGASGLCLAYKMNKMLRPGTWELTLFEKNDKLGGTWYENTYPGVACDIPSHIYTFTFDPKPDWSHFFAYGDEIQRYFEDFADRHNTHRYIKLNTKVIEGCWNDDKGIWDITLENVKTGEQFQDWAHVFVNGTGILNTWKWPNIEGLHDFKGPIMHSAKWDHSIDFKDKTVGVIGVGSSSVQIVPQLQKQCKKLEVFIRSPTWISPPFGAGVLESDVRNGQKASPGSRQYTFTTDDKKAFTNDPDKHLMFRKKIEAEINGIFGMFIEHSPMSEAFRSSITEEMHRRMGPGKEDLKKFLIPTWAPGCRRISPADGYLEALVADNVVPVLTEEGVKKIEPNGIVGPDGKVHECDIIVCATGFQVAFTPGFRVVNKDGKTVQDDWGESVNLYMGLAAPRFPNYFTVVGPGATWSNGTLLPSIETTIEYIVKAVDKMQAELIKSLVVKQSALDQLYAHFHQFHKNTVWKQDCRSWFKDGKKEGVIYLWPGPTIHFLKSIKTPRWEDYDYEYRYGNQFAYLGNGDVEATVKKDVLGLSTYIRAADTDWDVD